LTNQIEHTSPTLKYVCIVSYFTKHSSFLQKLCWVPANFTQQMILTHRFASFLLLHPPIHSFFWGAPSVPLLFLWCTLWLELWDFPITPQKPLLKRNGHLDPTNAPNARAIFIKCNRRCLLPSEIEYVACLRERADVQGRIELRSEGSVLYLYTPSLR